MNLKTFKQRCESIITETDVQLDKISDLLDDIDSEDTRPAEARAAFVQAQLAVADLSRKLHNLTQEDLEEDELADREDEDEDEEEESA